MAVRISNYKETLNNKNFKDYAFGLRYPYAMTNNTFDLAYDNITALKANIKNLLLTRRGERVAQPLFGTNLHALLFEQQTEELEQKIFDEIERSVGIWVPQVVVANIDIVSDINNTDNNLLEVKVTFQTNGELFDVEFTASNN